MPLPRADPTVLPFLRGRSPPRATAWASWVLEGLIVEALDGYYRIIGLDLSYLAVDYFQHKAPFGGTGANRNHCVLLELTLDAFAGHGLRIETETLHLDRGYDNNVAMAMCAELGLDDLVWAKKRKRCTATKKLPVPIGMRWPVEQTNSWLYNLRQLRRTPTATSASASPEFALAVAVILTVKIIKLAERWSSKQLSYRRALEALSGDDVLAPETARASSVIVDPTATRLPASGRCETTISVD